MAILGSTESIYYAVEIQPDDVHAYPWVVDVIYSELFEENAITYSEFEKYWIEQGCEIYELCDDELPDHIEDISGKICGEPDRVFAVVCPWGLQYVGLEIMPEGIEND